MSYRFSYPVLAASIGVLAAAASTVRTGPRVIATLGAYDWGDVAPSADGSFTLIATDSVLFKLDMVTHSVSTVARGQFWNVALSPTGNRIAFKRWKNDVPSVWSGHFDAARSVIDSITRIADSAREPAFSPDGRWIAFTGASGEAESLVVVNIAGERRVLPAGSGKDVFVAGWSRDGRSIYYTVNLGGPRKYAIYKVDLSSGVTRTIVEQNFEPRVRISPDERYLLYRPNSQAYSIATVNGVHVTDVDIEQFGFGRDIGDPEWLPGTSSLVFASRTEPRVLVAHALDGAATMTLSDSAAFTVSPAVSPDGKWLAAVTAGPANPRIMIRQLMGGQPRLIDIGTPIAQISQSMFLHWSPDGRYLAVPVGNVDPLVGHVNPAGAALVDVQSGKVLRLVGGAEVWSPDSRAVRYVHGYDSAAGPHRPIEIHEVTLDGRDRLVRQLNQCCGGARFVDFDHTYTKADGRLTDVRNGAHRTVMDTAILPVPDPGNVIPIACFTPDGKYAAMNTSASGRGPYNRVMMVSVETGERRLVDAGLTRMQPNAVFCHPDSKRVVVTGIDSARVGRAVSVAIDGSSRHEVAEVTRDVSGWIHVAITPDGKWLITSRTLQPGPLQIVTQATLPGGRR